MAEPVQDHRPDADNRKDLGKMQRFERRRVILRAEQQHGGEREEA